jgi:metal-responsive CopG/Arc/MetJ family transcriptional regulator
VTTLAKFNFSLPDEVKQEFNEVFADENKSAVLTRLIIQAIEEKKQLERRQKAVERILAMREQSPPISTADVCTILDEIRP